jgi:hypothetical protein
MMRVAHIREKAVPGWSLESIVCEPEIDFYYANRETGELRFEDNGNREIVCTFTNRQVADEREIWMPVIGKRYEFVPPR